MSMSHSFASQLLCCIANFTYCTRGIKAEVLAGTISRAEIEKTYKISRRVEAEERGLDSAAMVFTSTQQEIDQQWGLYEG